jgi:peroxiredoxin
LSGPRARILPILVAAAALALAAGAWVVVRPPADPPLRVGSEAPGFVLRDLDESEVALESFTGHVLFVNFWATWCPPCRDEAPGLERLYRKFKGEGFELLAVTIDTPDERAKVVSFRDEFGLSFPVLLDPDREVYGAFQATGVPETFLVDQNGHIRERFVGPRDWTEPRYESMVRRLLGAGEG